MLTEEHYWVSRQQNDWDYNSYIYLPCTYLKTLKKRLLFLDIPYYYLQRSDSLVHLTVAILLLVVRTGLLKADPIINTYPRKLKGVFRESCYFMYSRCFGFI